MSSFRREAAENCALLGYGMGPIGCTVTSDGNYHYSLLNPEKCNLAQKYVREYIM
jgi:hypothetical protein